MECVFFLFFFRMLGGDTMTEGIMPEQTSAFARFKALHARDGVFVMPNPWDAGSARLLASLGFEALATTSAGYAYSKGRPDDLGGLGRAEILANAAEIVAASALPVSADLGNGFGPAPETCAQTLQMACDIGLAGGSIEDATGDRGAPIYDIAQAVARIEAAAEVAQARGFVLTARAENHLWGRTDLADTIRRLQAYAEAGADVLFAPGLPDIAAIRSLCRELDKPVSVVMGLSGGDFSMAQLAEAGVRRISTGGSLARAAFGALMRAGQEMRQQGSFGYARDAIPDAVIAQMMAQPGAAEV